MTIKFFPKLDELIALLEQFDFAGKGDFHNFIHWLNGLSLQNKLMVGGFSYEEFCQLLRDHEWSEIRTRNSYIFTMPSGGKIEVVPHDDGSYTLRFIGKTQFTLPEGRLE